MYIYEMKEFDKSISKSLIKVFDCLIFVYDREGRFMNFSWRIMNEVDVGVDDLLILLFVVCLFCDGDGDVGVDYLFILLFIFIVMWWYVCVFLGCNFLFCFFYI